jgi:uncharacterized tellurite resistance protein B-like protein
MDIETRQKICQLVAGIVITDDILDDKEEAFIDRMIAGFGLPDTNRDVIFPLVDSEQAAEQMRALSKEAQAEALELLVQAACVDGEIAPEERTYLLTVGEAIGVSAEEIEQRLAAEMAK